MGLTPIQDYPTWKDLLKKAQAMDSTVPAEFCKCGQELWHGADRVPSVAYCDGIYWVRIDEKNRQFFAGFCPIWLAKHKQSTEETIMTFENFDRERQAFAYDFCLNWKPERNLILKGTNGIGKTHLARALYYKWFEQKKNCSWITHVDLANMFIEMQPTHDEYFEALSRYERLLRADILFLDDLRAKIGRDGKSTITEFFKDQFKALLDKRTAGVFAITTELGQNDIATAFNSAIESRLMESDLFVMHGNDYRKQSFRKLK